MKEFNEKVKMLRKQDEKERNSSEHIERVLCEIAKVKELKKGSEETWKQENIENKEIERINKRLKKDLELCQKHLNCLMKNNKGVEENLAHYEETNKVVIKKLERVSTDRSYGK